MGQLTTLQEEAEASREEKSSIASGLPLDPDPEQGLIGMIHTRVVLERG